jgi:hypothetical protein
LAAGAEVRHRESAAAEEAGHDERDHQWVSGAPSGVDDRFDPTVCGRSTAAA